MRTTLLVLLVACGTDRIPPAVTDIPSNPAGVFSLHSAYDIAAMPGGIVDEWEVAADDPARYLAERIVAGLPDGPVKTAAHQAIPFVAAYLDGQLAEIAPRLQRGLAEASVKLVAIATRFGTNEILRVTHQSNATRTIAGFRFLVGSAPVDVAFADHGDPDATVAVKLELDKAGNLAIAEHVVQLSYGRLLRLGLDHAVVPSIVPSATGVAEMLRNLVDCKRVGKLVSDALGANAPDVFATACTIGLVAAARELDDRLAGLDASPLVLDATGAARGVDMDHDGSMDAIVDGLWSGTARVTAGAVPLAGSTFLGARM
jgi:hypothetical protein